MSGNRSNVDDLFKYIGVITGGVLTNSPALVEDGDSVDVVKMGMDSSAETLQFAQSKCRPVVMVRKNKFITVVYKVPDFETPPSPVSMVQDQRQSPASSTAANDEVDDDNDTFVTAREPSLPSESYFSSGFAGDLVQERPMNSKQRTKNSEKLASDPFSNRDVGLGEVEKFGSTLDSAGFRVPFTTSTPLDFSRRLSLGVLNASSASSQLSTSSSRRKRRLLSESVHDPKCRSTANMNRTNGSLVDSRSNGVIKVPYSKREICAIYDGVRRYGLEWRTILWAYRPQFDPSRTAVKLYDKWRHDLRHYSKEQYLLKHKAELK